jgi:hypothetical protein
MERTLQAASSGPMGRRFRRRKASQQTVSLRLMGKVGQQPVRPHRPDVALWSRVHA